MSNEPLKPKKGYWIVGMYGIMVPSAGVNRIYCGEVTSVDYHGCRTRIRKGKNVHIRNNDMFGIYKTKQEALSAHVMIAAKWDEYNKKIKSLNKEIGNILKLQKEETAFVAQMIIPINEEE